MNFTHYLTLTLGTAIGGITATASTFDELTRTGVVWATGVSKEEGWYDANKNAPWDGDADDLMCYAACAANLVAWWQNGEYGKKLTSSAPGDIDSIWKKYVTSNLLPL
ncbi:MAG: IdeS/Mac family cysteine endopeptidase [Akkermansia sp.]|nr:IdeS/Mac family cysteine endopeptidase [Akkermansia sp.]